jgi:4-hydroxy-tetrahydrodipicolinate reductase
MIDIVVCGALGRMGRAVTGRILDSSDLRLAGSVVEQKDASVNCSVKLTPEGDIGELLRKEKGSVVVEFTEPEATLRHARASLSTGHNMVIGTTGLSDRQIEYLKEETEKSQTSIVLSPNFSLGMNAVFGAVGMLSDVLRGYDTSIVEIHHKSKKDKPSGTARALSERTGGKTEIHSIRAGEVFGEHIVLFAGAGETIEIKHQALSRDCFASGALQAARWVQGRRDGKVHSMSEVLGL